MEASYPFKRLRRLLIHLVGPSITVLTTAFLVGCDGPQPVPEAPRAKRVLKTNEIREPAGAQRLSDVQQKQLKVLHKIYAADPELRAIASATIDDGNELSVMLNPNLELTEVPRVMTEVLEEMAQEFPGQNLTAVAYVPSDPPRKIGVARLDGETGRVNFEWDLPSEEEQFDEQAPSEMFIKDRPRDRTGGLVL